MRVPRSLLNCVVFVATAMSAFGQSVEPDLNPTLGPAILLSTDANSSTDSQVLPSEAELGPIILIASIADADDNDDSPTSPKFLKDEGHYPFVSEVKNSSHLGMLPIPIFIPLIPQLTNEPLPLRVSQIPVHPDQIQFHLSEAVRHLASVGLAGQAEKIQELQQQIHHEHTQRLLIAFKEAQLRELQSEIALLKRDQPMDDLQFLKESQNDDLPSEIVRPRQIQQTSAMQPQNKVTIGTRFIEVNANAQSSLLRKLFGGQPVPTKNIGNGLFAPTAVNQEISDLINAFCQRGEAKETWTPSLILRVGETGRIFQEEGTENGCGTAFSLSATTGLSTNGNLRISLTGENSTELAALNADGIKSVTKNRNESIVEIQSGQTVALNVPQNPQIDANGVVQTRSVLILVTAVVGTTIEEDSATNNAKATK